MFCALFSFFIIIFFCSINFNIYFDSAISSSNKCVFELHVFFSVLFFLLLISDKLTKNKNKDKHLFYSAIRKKKCTFWRKKIIMKKNSFYRCPKGEKQQLRLLRDIHFSRTNKNLPPCACFHMYFDCVFLSFSRK